MKLKTFSLWYLISYDRWHASL